MRLLHLGGLGSPAAGGGDCAVVDGVDVDGGRGQLCRFLVIVIISIASSSVNSSPCSVKNAGPSGNSSTNLDWMDSTVVIVCSH